MTLSDTDTSHEQRSQAATQNEFIAEHQEITGELDTKPAYNTKTQFLPGVAPLVTQQDRSSLKGTIKHPFKSPEYLRLRLQHGLESQTFRLPTLLIYSLVQHEPTHSNIHYLYRQSDSLEEHFLTSVVQACSHSFSMSVYCRPSGADSDSTASDGALDSRLSTPRAPVVGHATPLRSASDRSFPAHSTDLGKPNPSSSLSIVDYDDDNWSGAVDIDSVPPLQLHVPSPAASFPVAVEVGPMGSTARTGGAPACSKQLRTAPCPSR